MVPQEKVKQLVGRIESKLSTLESVFHQSPPGAFRIDQEFDFDLDQLLHSAGALGVHHSELVETLIEDYNSFKQAPDSDKLQILFLDVQRLSLFLKG